jgi:hypothetical protein
MAEAEISTDVIYWSGCPCCFSSFGVGVLVVASNLLPVYLGALGVLAVPRPVYLGALGVLAVPRVRWRELLGETLTDIGCFHMPP